MLYYTRQSVKKFIYSKLRLAALLIRSAAKLHERFSENAVFQHIESELTW